MISFHISLLILMIIYSWQLLKEARKRAFLSLLRVLASFTNLFINRIKLNLNLMRIRYGYNLKVLLLCIFYNTQNSIYFTKIVFFVKYFYCDVNFYWQNKWIQACYKFLWNKFLYIKFSSDFYYYISSLVIIYINHIIIRVPFLFSEK